MTITEKTVELNVTRTIIEKMRRTNQMNAYAVGASQGQEKEFGFDVLATDGTWLGEFIQYKRLYVNGAKHRWNLNRTTYRDQHTMLCALEALGFPVYYGFPKFDSETTLRQWTPPSLWRQVWWVRPSVIPVPAPIDEHHHVIYDTATGVWTVHSEDRLEFDPGDTDFSSVEKRLLDMNTETHSLKRFKDEYRKLMTKRWDAISSVPDRTRRTNIHSLQSYMRNAAKGRGIIVFQP
ncbi:MULTISPECIES: hypothetical protein [unclassified Herbaspirillum]|uniref:hypothetical protein n=1 Tax=unclassified Herbaspirillum TaxID=2624150 RepID=UPI00107194B0|nr:MULTISPECIES: hypothetical protein [unclassified Herbaspirillum]TFI08643.1 hypothetical protein E4P32_10880 [Herbaspirillum sp. 3R11]TFI15057.1 hypothetical protein E4P31_10875 [Herbaspirillum sp. 3R-11]TFI29753.1 hypothetical protein E4P30_05665 [Herbaspirillum sp. 3C11]